MSEIHTYKWDARHRCMMRQTTLDRQRRPDLDVTIDLAKNQITQQGATTTLSSTDNYLFLEFMRRMEATPDLMSALFRNTYYTDTFLSDSLGPFVVPNAPDLSSYLLIFSSLVVPYENLYGELHRKPQYARRLLEIYDARHNVGLRYVKEAMRLLLVVPGIPITPMLFIVVHQILNKKS